MMYQNKYFEKPTRMEFQAQMREALRISKERHRSRSRKRTATRSGGARNQRDFWNDKRSNESAGNEEKNFTDGEDL